MSDSNMKAPYFHRAPVSCVPREMESCCIDWQDICCPITRQATVTGSLAFSETFLINGSFDMNCTSKPHSVVLSDQLVPVPTVKSFFIKT